MTDSRSELCIGQAIVLAWISGSFVLIVLGLTAPDIWSQMLLSMGLVSLFALVLCVCFGPYHSQVAVIPEAEVQENDVETKI